MKKQRLSDAYQFKGFAPEHEVQGIATDAEARTIRLKRRQKKLFVRCVAKIAERFTIAQTGLFGTYLAAICESTSTSKYVGYAVNGAR